MTVNVNDANDNHPIWSQPVYDFGKYFMASKKPFRLSLHILFCFLVGVDENAAADTIVGRLSVSCPSPGYRTLAYRTNDLSACIWWGRYCVSVLSHDYICYDYVYLP